MSRVLLVAIILSLLFPLTAFGTSEIKAGFIRNGNLWVLLNNKEKQITSTGKVFSKPKWSPDGKWLLYQIATPSHFPDKEEQSEVLTYHLESKKKKKIFYDGYSPTWAPHKNVIAFNQLGTLTIRILNNSIILQPAFTVILGYLMEVGFCSHLQSPSAGWMDKCNPVY